MDLKLTQEQQAVVDHNSGPALVFAVAGAGKTTAMVHRIERLVREELFPPQRILATSFGRSNVQDLRRDLNAWPYCNRVETRTLHSLGRNIIQCAQQQGYLNHSNLSTASDSPEKADHQILNLALQQARQRELPFAKELENLDRHDFLAYVDSCKGNLQYAALENVYMPPSLLTKAEQAPAPNGPLFWYLDLYRLYEEVRQSRGLITFADMLMSGWQTLATYPEVLSQVQRSYDCVLVDEFQDVNKAQSEILDLITEPHRNYMAIGDDDQTIYEWRGASPNYILNFQKRYAAEIYLIADNFRCPAGPLTLANQVIAHNKQRQRKRLSLTQGFRGRATVNRSPDLPTMAGDIVAEIGRLQQGGHRLNDMAVLVRLNAQTPHIEQKLIDAQIPYRVSSPFYERPEIVTLINYCRLAWVERQLVTDPLLLQRSSIAEMVAGAWYDIANRPKRYISNQHRQQILNDILRWAILPSRTLVKYAELVDEDWLFESLAKLVTDIEWLSKRLDKPAGKTLSALEARLSYKQFLRESSGFSQTGQAKAASAAAFIDYARAYNTLLSFMQHIRQLAESGVGRPQAESIVEPAAITISTIHKAKGLEWPVVFVPQCNEGIIPFLDDGQNRNIEEERRLLYVAITRARHSLYLYAIQNEPISRFLKQANWRTMLKAVTVLQRILNKAPVQWQVEDALTVAKEVPALNLQRYLQLWWDIPSVEQQEIAHTMQRFYAAIEHHKLFRRLGLAPSGVTLWREISPLPAQTTIDSFPGLEPYLPEKKARPSPLPTRIGHSPKARSDLLNQRIKRIPELGKRATGQAIQELIKGLDDPSPVVAYMSATELRRIGGLRVVDALGRHLKYTKAKRPDEVRKLLTIIAETDDNPAAQNRARLILDGL